MDYLNYIYFDSFGTFDYEEMEAIDDFFNNKNQFFDSESYELAISYLIEKQDFKQAKNFLEKAQKQFPNTGEFRLLEIFIRKNESLSAASELCDKYYKLNNDIDLILLKSTILFEQKDYKAGEKIFFQYAEKLTDNNEKVEAHYQIALFLNGSKFETEEETDEDFMTRTMLIKMLVEQALTYNFPKDEMIIYASQFYMHDNVREAKAILNRVIDLDSYNKDAWELLSEILFDDEQYSEAAEAYKYRIAIGDSNETNYYQCGVCYERMENYKEALEYYIKQEEMFPQLLADNKEFYCYLLNSQANCLLQINLPSDALTIYKKVLKIDSNNFRALVQSAQCLQKEGKNNDALKCLTKALKLKNDAANEYENIYSTMGDIFVDISSFKMDNEEECKELLINAILAYSKSIIYYNLPQKTQNLSYDAIDRANSFKILQIGRAYFLLGNYIQALLNFQMAYALNDSLPGLDLYLTLSYFELDFVDAAIVHFAKIPTDTVNEYKTLLPALKKIEKIYLSKI